MMMLDVERLDDRVRKLASHFGMVEKDIEQILISSEKVTKRGKGIGTIGLTPIESSAAPTAPKLVESDLFKAGK